MSNYYVVTRNIRRAALFVLMLCGLVALLVTCTGCEARKFTATRPDVTFITYERVGDSHSEGVSVSKQGEDLTVDVGATGSEAKVEVLQAVLEAIK